MLFWLLSTVMPLKRGDGMLIILKIKISNFSTKKNPRSFPQYPPICEIRRLPPILKKLNEQWCLTIVSKFSDLKNLQSKYNVARSPKRRAVTRQEKCRVKTLLGFKPSILHYLSITLHKIKWVNTFHDTSCNWPYVNDTYWAL